MSFGKVYLVTRRKTKETYAVSKNFIDWKTITNGPIRTSFELTYGDWEANGKIISEKKIIYKRINEISRIAELLNKKSNDKINFSNLLIELAKRALNENRFERNLFFH